jgi:large repetitive protein
MSSNKRKLQILGGFTVLLLAALAVGCSGFFVNPTLTSIAVSPTSPQVQVGKTLVLEAFGTYDDGSRKRITNGVNWSSDTIGVATIDTASGTLTGVAPGQSTVTASAQALSGTATATVLLTNVTAITVDPTSGSVTRGGDGQIFTFTATSGGSLIPLTTDLGGVLTITPTSSDVFCDVSGNDELCSADTNAVVGTYTVTMTYPGSSAFARATLNVQ